MYIPNYAAHQPSLLSAAEIARKPRLWTSRVRNMKSRREAGHIRAPVSQSHTFGYGRQGWCTAKLVSVASAGALLVPSSLLWRTGWKEIEDGHRRFKVVLAAGCDKRTWANAGVESFGRR